MKNLKLWLSCVIVAGLIIATGGYRTVSAEYASVSQDTKARVLQVIDGDALKVALSGSGQIALIRLAGISTDGNADAFSYMASQLLGRDVDIKLDEVIRGTTIDGRWTPVYVYYENTLYNRVLLQKGLAHTDELYSNVTLYNTLLNDERVARSRLLGIWTPDTRNEKTAGSNAYAGYDRVNINTATASQLQEALPGISASSARAIVRYRDYTPYNIVREVKFSGGLTRAQFDEYLGLMVVCTNINTATDEELRMTGFTSSELRALRKYRDSSAFTNIYQLHTENIISYEKYRDIEPFIAISDYDTIKLVTSYKTADINNDSVDALLAAAASAGLSESAAQLIVNARVNGYTFKSLGEIQMISGIGLSDGQIHQLANYLVVDPAYDIMNVPAYINLNTASTDLLIDAGFTRSQATEIARTRSRLRSARDLPIDLGAMGMRCTLYTNINVTTAVELMSLSDNMTANFASVLVNAADRQPFGTMNELSDFFAEYEETALFKKIRDYLIFR